MLNEGNINAIVINRARIVSWTKVELEERETRKIMTDNVCDTTP